MQCEPVPSDRYVARMHVSPEMQQRQQQQYPAQVQQQFTVKVINLQNLSGQVSQVEWRSHRFHNYRPLMVKVKVHRLWSDIYTIFI